MTKRLSALLILLLSSISMARGVSAPSPPEDCGQFVQQFYDWYMAREKASMNGKSQESAFDATLSEKQSSFTPELVQALKLAASKESPDEGLGFDPFLNSQDPAEHYVVGEVHQEGDHYLVDVFSAWEGKKNPKPDVVAELALTKGEWVFTNFHYRYSDTPVEESLVSILQQLKKVDADVPMRQSPSPALTLAQPTALTPQGNQQPANETGAIPEGSMFGISGVFITETPDMESDTHLVFHVSVKRRPNAVIDHRKVRTQVFFYDTVNDRDIKLTDAKVDYEWLNPDHDWARPQPEVLAVTYVRPKNKAEPSSTEGDSEHRKYLGYVVRVYYDGKLQAARASPTRLLDLLPQPTSGSTSLPSLSETDHTGSGSMFESSSDFAKYAMRLREEAVLKVEPQVFVPTRPTHAAHDELLPPFGFRWLDPMPRVENVLTGNKTEIVARKKKGDWDIWTVKGLVHPGLKRTLFTFKKGALVHMELQYEYPDRSLEWHNQRLAEIRRYFDAKFGTGKLVSPSRDNDSDVVKTLVGYRWMVGATMLELFYFSAQHEDLVFRMITVDYRAL